MSGRSATRHRFDGWVVGSWCLHAGLCLVFTCRIVCGVWCLVLTCRLCLVFSFGVGCLAAGLR